MKKTTQLNKGFTLLELLVVISIIAVLAVLGFMAATRMRTTANKAITTANMRQIGAALVSFTSDNGRFPSAIGDPVWDRAILSNLGFSETLTGSGPITKSAVPALAEVARIFTTPEDKVKRDTQLYPRSFSIVPWTTNWSDGTTFRGWKNRTPNKGVPYSILDNPAKAAMVVQCYGYVPGLDNQFGNSSYAISDSGMPPNLLAPEQQVLFADGHVEKIKADMPLDEFVRKYWPGTIGK